MFRRRLILLGVCAVVLCGAIAVWQMTRLPPAWYAPPNATDPAVVELADRVEYRLVQEAQQIRLTASSTGFSDSSEPWTLRIREDQINVWLAARLRKWVEREEGAQWPEHLGVPQVRIEARGISVAVPLNAEASSGFIVARIQPQMEAGQLRLTLDQIAMGRVAIPGAPVAFLANALSGDELGGTANSNAEDSLFDDVIDWLARGEPLEPILTLTDGRRVQLLNVICGEGTLDCTARTLPTGLERGE